MTHTLEGKHTLAEQEAIFWHAEHRAAYDMGGAVYTIHTYKLYTDSPYADFSKYCEEVLRIKAKRAYQLIAFYTCVKQIQEVAQSTRVDAEPLPMNEAQTRYLSPLPSPALQLAAWQQTLHQYGPNPTLLQVRGVASFYRTLKPTDNWQDEATEEALGKHIARIAARSSTPKPGKRHMALPASSSDIPMTTFLDGSTPCRDIATATKWVNAMLDDFDVWTGMLDEDAPGEVDDLIGALRLVIAELMSKIGAVDAADDDSVEEIDDAAADD